MGNLREIIIEGDRGYFIGQIKWPGLTFFWGARISELGASLLILVGTKPLEAGLKVA